MSKFLERLVCDQIQQYMEVSDQLDPCQLAYRRGFSTQTCILRMLDDVREAVDRRMVTVAVLFDLSKAFDRVDHCLLIRKLENLGFSVPVLRWIWFYLNDRFQTVKDPMSGEISALPSEGWDWGASRVCPRSTTIYFIYRSSWSFQLL